MLQQQGDLQGSSVAPSPIVPTCRRSPPLSKRGHPSMSNIPGGDPQSLGLSHLQNRNENVPDLVQFFQAQDSLSATSSQSGSARDIFKAGQRRLRQLAQRPKWGTDPHAKSDDASRQVLALQQAGFLPVSLPPSKSKKSSPKRSIDSTVSSTRSASNLSFQSSSRRDVESIGQPWLEGSLEKPDPHKLRGRRVSSLDLRDITSLVDAALPRPPQFEDVTPPPYQAATQSSNHDLQADSFHPATLHSSTSRPSDPLDEIEALPKVPEIPDRTSSHHIRISTSASEGKKQPIHEQPGESKPAGPKDTPEAAGSKSLSSNAPHTMQSQSNPVAQTLKLFPDTMPPRMPNKGAWRIQSGCPPPSIGSLPAISAQQSTPVGSTYSSDRSTKSSFSTQNCDAEPENPGRVDRISPTQRTDPNRNSVTSQRYEKLLLARNGRRPASLPMGAIDAFPLPAPMRPLPALPEAVRGARPIYGQDTAASRGGPHVRQHQQDSQLPKEEPIPMGSATRRDNHGSLTGQAAPSASKSKAATDRENKLARAGTSNSKPVTSTGAGQSRANRVRALKKKDMSASRVYLQDPENYPLEEGQQSLSRPFHTASSEEYDEATAAPRCIDKGIGDQYDKGSADTQATPPASNGLGFLGQSTEAHTIGKRDSNPLGYENATSLDIHEPSSLPASKRNSQIYPSGSSQSTSILSQTVANDLDLRERSETPLPSSEDEGMDVGLRKQQVHSISSRRRQPRLAPINIDEPSTRKTRHTKKPLEYECSRPITPRDRRNQGLEKTSPQSPHLQGSYHYYEARGSRHQRSYIRELENRIAHLEHQNRTLQAALLGALGVGGKQNIEGLLGGSSTSLSTPPTSGTVSSMTNSSSSPDSHTMKKARHTHRRQPPYRPETWIASPGSSRRSSYGSEVSADIRELENMIEDFDFGWESDQPSPERAHRLRMRA
ncbi:hypothetical protein BDV26DRAFT_32724 [Aspergillus bertholletiae]|uniref:Uncharacterized protein n=1 Tax=Aspergillus bertholletiae TaxID=1226010 RepID=A0A5N7AY91_9EURO|nr:hypothetical protein BDV26DRAFT_32724 [Aspergillus bertholletiae]